MQDKDNSGATSDNQLKWNNVTSNLAIVTDIYKFQATEKQGFVQGSETSS